MIGHKIVIAIDPGFGGTGMAMFVGKRLYKFHNVKTSEEKEARYKDVASKCVRTVLNWCNDLKAVARDAEESLISDVAIIIESPHVFNGAKGAAALGRGDVFTVAKLVGAISVLLETHLESYLEAQDIAYRIIVKHPEPRKWKGQAPKNVTKRRVLRDVKYATDFIVKTLYKLKPEFPDHIFDAVGLGMWWIKQNEDLYTI